MKLHCCNDRPNVLEAEKRSACCAVENWNLVGSAAGGTCASSFPLPCSLVSLFLPLGLGCPHQLSLHLPNCPLPKSLSLLHTHTQAVTLHTNDLSLRNRVVHWYSHNMALFLISLHFSELHTLIRNTETNLRSHQRATSSDGYSPAFENEQTRNGSKYYAGWLLNLTKFNTNKYQYIII